MKEHRRFNRTDFHTKGYFTNGDKTTHFNIINISLNGILLEPHDNDEIDSNTNVLLNIQLSSSDIEIKTKSKLQHKEDKHLGFRFLEIDVESMIHLRRLVELNSDSADQIANELHFLEKD